MIMDFITRSFALIVVHVIFLTRYVCHSANETLYRSDDPSTAFNTWYSDGNFAYSVDETGVLGKDCIESFVRSDSGYLYSPVIDIHPQSDISILAEFDIKPCSDIAPENAPDVDKLRICSPLLGLSYVKLDSFENLFLEKSNEVSFFAPVKVSGVNSDASFTAIDNLASTNKDSQGDGGPIYTTRTFDVKSLSGKVQFRVEDEGACFILKRFVVYRKMCSSFTKELQYFPKTFSSSGTVTSVTGKCVAYSRASRNSDLSTLHCQATGDWLSYDVSSTCLCGAGYEAIEDVKECSPCRSGYFKATEGNDECFSCPRNSNSQKPGSAFCNCLDGFSRGDSEISTPCTKPITQNVTNIRVLPFDEFVKLSWHAVSAEGDSSEPVSYLITCNLKSSTTSKTTRTVNDTTHVIVSSKLLQPSEMYKCSIGATNKATTNVLYQSIEFRTHSPILPVKLETRPVGIEDSWHLHWEAPEDKADIEEMVEAFDSSVQTSYSIHGYYILAQERSGRQHIKHQESAFSVNTTVDLDYLFPKFNNKFENVSFEVFIVHQLDGVVINSSRTISVYSQNNPTDGGSRYGLGGPTVAGDMFHWLDVMPMKYTGIAITATLLISLFVCLCILCTILQFKKNKKEKRKYDIKAEMGLGMHQGQYGPASMSGMFATQSYHATTGFMDLNANGVNPSTFRDNYENNYDDLEEFQRVTGAPTNFQQNDISKAQLSCKEQIGRGRFSNVFRARYTYQEQGGMQGSIMVAIKEPEKDALDSEMQREINIMAQLTHQNIVRLIGIVQPTNSRERQLIVMEYMEYGSLEQFLVQNKSTSLPAAYLLKILLDVANAMKYLHENNFVHRDLAARNVLVGRNTSSSIYNHLHMTDDDHQPVICKLSDFGLCRSVEHDSDLTYVFLHSKNPLVPIRWLAPEVADEKGATFAGDVWSYAVVTWEVFSFGKRPYWKWDSANIMAAVKDGYRLPAPLAIPAVVYDDLLTTCWRTDPTQRPSFNAIVDKIEELLATPEALLDLLRSSNFNPFHPEAKELVLNSENNVERWLKLLKMEQHLDKFRERDFSNLTQLTKVSYNQLKNDFGIQLVGNIRKLIQSIEVIRELQNDQSSSSTNQATTNNTRRSLALIDQSLNNWCFSPNGVEAFTATTEI